MAVLADQEAGWDELRRCIDLLLCAPQASGAHCANIYTERAVRFLATFSAVRQAGREVEGDTLVEDVLSYLLSLAQAADKGVRQRVCQVLAAALAQQAELSPEVAEELEAALLARLRDKVPAVRAEAAKALSVFADPGMGGDFADCAVCEGLLALLQAEKNKDVRKAVLAALPVARGSVPLAEFVERTRDISDEVRRMVFLVARDKLPLAALAKEQAVVLVRRGLADRTPAVAKAASSLLAAWFAALKADVALEPSATRERGRMRDGMCEGGDAAMLPADVEEEGGVPAGPSPPRAPAPDLVAPELEPLLVLLGALGPEQHEAEAEAALRALIASGALDPRELAHAGGPQGGLRRGLDAALLGPAEALLWRVLAEWLQARRGIIGVLFPEAGAARGRAAAAASGAAAAVEAADAGDALAALEALLPESVEGLMGLVRAHAASPGSCFAARQLLALAGTCADLADASGRRAASELLQVLLGFGLSAAPEGRAWAHAVLALARQVHTRRADMVGALADALACCLPQDGSAAAGSEELWQHRLGLAAMLLEQLPPPRARQAQSMVGTLPGDIANLHTTLLAPALEHHSAAVRAGAVRCIGLACLLGEPGARHQTLAVPAARHTRARWLAECGLPALRTGLLLDGNPEVSAAAVAALCDLALLWGPRALDQLSAHPLEPSAASAAGHDAAADPDGAAAAAAAAALPATAAPALAAAALPAARRALAAAPKPARSAAPRLLRYVLQLLQEGGPPQGTAAGESDPAGPTPEGLDPGPCEALAEAALAEALACPPGPAARPYAAALVQLAAGLPLVGRGCQGKVKRLRELAARAAAKLGSGPAGREAAALAARLQALDATPAQGLDADALAALVAAVEAHAAQGVLPFGDAGAAEPGTASRRGGAASRAARQECDTSASSNEDESESEEEVAGSSASEAAPPARATPPLRSSRQRTGARGAVAASAQKTRAARPVRGSRAAGAENVPST
ncbi:hypothetical protein WJX81_001000 [Elliptochloris bilobata]|uniref:Nuclear condensin complex subunit 3 C-terminal domain-containing protein n=1 Tax=Elliptochloris bilobata TaxID=381761 RepID=A0AAW1QKD3_9CHLO